MDHFVEVYVFAAHTKIVNNVFMLSVLHLVDKTRKNHLHFYSQHEIYWGSGEQIPFDSYVLVNVWLCSKYIGVLLAGANVFLSILGSI